MEFSLLGEESEEEKRGSGKSETALCCRPPQRERVRETVGTFSTLFAHVCIVDRVQ